MMRWIFSTLLIVVIVSNGGCVLNSGEERYNVSGWITTEDGEPLEGIVVSLGETTVLTDSEGFYKFTKVKVYNYYIMANPYDTNKIYTFKPSGHIITITEDTTVNFTAIDD